MNDQYKGWREAVVFRHQVEHIERELELLRQRIAELERTERRRIAGINW